MENRNDNRGNGFLFGLIVGVAVTLLFTTKKGREILRELTDRGMEKIGDLEEKIDRKQTEFEQELEEEEGDDYIETLPDLKKPLAGSIEEEKSEANPSSKGQVEKPKKSPRRFFKGKKS